MRCNFDPINRDLSAARAGIPRGNRVAPEPTPVGALFSLSGEHRAIKRFHERTLGSSGALWSLTF